jgi:hypothetical protein
LIDRNISAFSQLLTQFVFGVVSTQESPDCRFVFFCLFLLIQNSEKLIALCLEGLACDFGAFE